MKNQKKVKGEFNNFLKSVNLVKIKAMFIKK